MVVRMDYDLNQEVSLVLVDSSVVVERRPWPKAKVVDRWEVTTFFGSISHLTVQYNDNNNPGDNWGYELRRIHMFHMSFRYT